MEEAVLFLLCFVIGEVFASTSLDVVVPDTSLDFPSQNCIDSWLDRIKSVSVDRKQSFFDEQLRTFLVLRIKHPAAESDVPPKPLLSFLVHLQVSFEATYISPVPEIQEDVKFTNLANPPRPSLPKGNPRSSSHPSILPPNTPNPTPATKEQDRKYVASEGTLLLAGIFGQNPSPDASEDFTLLWSPGEQLWIAVYSFSLTVSYLRLNVPDPLLCLTVSATLRDKPITSASSINPLTSYLAKVGGQSALDTPASENKEDEKKSSDEDQLYGFEEVNLLQGLHGGPLFGSGPSAVSLLSTRLGTVSRQKLFSLPPINLPSAVPPEPSPMTALRAVHPTLRKSFRKTLDTASGFRVRMRTVFVPYMLLSRRHRAPSVNGEDERDIREAGNEERTVVLCIEIENSNDSVPNIGFEVEKVDVRVGGGDAEAHLIGWGKSSFRNMDESKIFPLRIGSSTQYNLLYAVWFLHPPDELNMLPFGNSQNPLDHSGLQRAVAIYIHGKPYENIMLDGAPSDPPALRYPTRTFSSRWNCVLDLGIHDYRNLTSNDDIDPSDPSNKYPSVLPEPASPFPLSGARAGGFFTPDQSTPATTPRSSLMAGFQRLSFFPKTPTSGQPFTPSKTFYRPNDQQFTPPSSARQSFLLPSQSLAAAAQILHSPTTHAGSATPAGMPAEDNHHRETTPPLTPAYPPHSPYPPSPMSQGPIAVQGAGSVGMSVETRRERGSGLGLASAISPTTPVPGANGYHSFADQQQAASTKLLQQKLDSGQSIVISVRLMSPRERGDLENKDERIYPLSRFAIEVFIFNRSTWTRRFELSYPHNVRSRRQERATSGDQEANEASVNRPAYPGILPLENRVRIGPLLPSACQTVRMQFLAVAAGVHSIDVLTLTDIESGHSMNLRSVMDIVVHEVLP